MCEQAAELIQPWLSQGWELEEVDIASDPSLFERYGVLIPVLKYRENELNWPFDAVSLAGFLGG